MEQSKTYEPNILVDTSDLPRDEWLKYRRLGIGGSDAAAILGISPFRTARDLYYDKLNIVTADDEGNWVAMEMGNLLEPLVARIFAKKTGLKVFQRKCMFQHPHYPWMLADLDYLVELPDGSIAILEIKTTNYNAKDNWWYNGKEIVPIYYESQGRHYMSVMNINRVYFCCLYGNNENVLAKVPPPYTEDGELILESLRRKLGPSEKDAPPVVFSMPQYPKIARYIELQKQKSEVNKSLEQIKSEMTRLKGLLVEAMGTSCQATYEDTDRQYTVTFNPVRTPGITKEGLERMKEVHPDIYEEYVTISESRRFYIKETKPKAA